MDQVRTSPRNTIVAFAAATALAVGGWLAVGGSSFSSDLAGPKTDDGRGSVRWR